MDIFDFCRQQAATITRLQNDVKHHANASEPAAKPARKKLTLATRGRMSASWTQERRAAQGRRMADRWAFVALEKATRPDNYPNGNGSLSL